MTLIMNLFDKKVLYILILYNRKIINRTRLKVIFKPIILNTKYYLNKKNDLLKRHNFETI